MATLSPRDDAIVIEDLRRPYAVGVVLAELKDPTGGHPEYAYCLSVPTDPDEAGEVHSAIAYQYVQAAPRAAPDVAERHLKYLREHAEHHFLVLARYSPNDIKLLGGIEAKAIVYPDGQSYLRVWQRAWGWVKGKRYYEWSHPGKLERTHTVRLGIMWSGFLYSIDISVESYKVWSTLLDKYEAEGKRMEAITPIP